MSCVSTDCCCLGIGASSYQTLPRTASPPGGERSTVVKRTKERREGIPNAGLPQVESPSVVLSESIGPHVRQDFNLSLPVLV